MALVVHPEGTQVSGSIGGTVWSHNRYGAYKRNRSVPVNPNTDRQVAVRNAVRSLTIAWQTILTQVQRDAWDVYAANIDWINHLGQTVNLTGLNHYVRSNTPLVQHGLARVDAAPTVMDIGIAELFLGATASEATQQVSCTFSLVPDWATEAGAWQFFAMGLPQNAAIKFFGSPFRHLGIIHGGDPAVSPMVAPASFPIAEGQRIWIRTRIARADGRLSEFAQVNFLCAA